MFYNLHKYTHFLVSYPRVHIINSSLLLRSPTLYNQNINAYYDIILFDWWAKLYISLFFVCQYRRNIVHCWEDDDDHKAVEHKHKQFHSVIIFYFPERENVNYMHYIYRNMKLWNIITFNTYIIHRFWNLQIYNAKGFWIFN